MKDMSRATLLKLARRHGRWAPSSSRRSWSRSTGWGMDGSVEKGQIATMFNVMIVLSALVFSVVMVMMGYAIWKYRAKPGDESDGEPIHGNTRLEIIWTAIPTVIVLVLAASTRRSCSTTSRRRPTRRRWRSTSPPSSSPGASTTPSRASPRPSSTSRRAPSSSSQLNALDVLHSFWVPEWGIKRDLVPGSDLPGGDEIDNTVSVTPDVRGHLLGRLHRALRLGACDDARPPRSSRRRRTSTRGRPSRRSSTRTTRAPAWAAARGPASTRISCSRWTDDDLQEVRAQCQQR